MFFTRTPPASFPILHQDKDGGGGCAKSRPFVTRKCACSMLERGHPPRETKTSHTHASSSLRRFSFVDVKFSTFPLLTCCSALFIYDKPLSPRRLTTVVFAVVVALHVVVLCFVSVPCFEDRVYDTECVFFCFAFASFVCLFMFTNLFFFSA